MSRVFAHVFDSRYAGGVSSFTVYPNEMARRCVNSPDRETTGGKSRV